ncbi:MFS transporter [Neobacillus pocheonensis]|uniref:MFS transporter n=1 Tax=Neobacillus pocheonensis TaxID=363869 RepID=UPI003D2AB254
MDYSKNVNKLYFIMFFHNLIPAYVIERLFWEQRGMTVFMVVLCEIIYAVTIVILEIPTGILADKFGRKVLLVIGGALSILEFIILLFAKHFWIFALVVFLAGIAGACISGALNALLYDTLLLENREKSFEKIIGRLNSIDFIGSLLAALSGSVLAKFFGFEINYMLSAVSMFVAFGFTIFLKEPPRKHNPDEIKYMTNGIKDYFFSSISFYRNNPKLIVMIFHAMAIAACVNYLDEFWQLYLDKIGFSVIFFGLFSALISISRIPGNLMAGYLTKYFPVEFILLIVLGVTTIGFLISAFFHGLIGVAMIIIIFLISGVVDPVVTGYLHYHANSEIRATIDSIQSLIQKLLVFIVGIGFGIISSEYTIFSGFIFLGTFMSIFFLLYLKNVNMK